MPHINSNQNQFKIIIIKEMGLNTYSIQKL